MEVLYFVHRCVARCNAAPSNTPMHKVKFWFYSDEKTGPCAVNVLAISARDAQGWISI